ncbi:hypothetical protein DFJ63DRAFT_24770 [Scheffersomyces coipomensis]|uniref:uncharacterized protein n=1 Tax=Scheffersomyces coipomensis TaxID=1788519 RepID=UPI00315D3FAC
MTHATSPPSKLGQTAVGQVAAKLVKVATSSPLNSKNHHDIKPLKSTEELTKEIHLSEEDDGDYDDLSIGSNNLPLNRTAVVAPPRHPLSSGSSIHSIPNWVYGTTNSLPRSSSISSAVSGLCLTERGQVAVPHPEIIQNLLFPSSDSLKQKIMIYREKVNQVLNQDITNSESCKEPLLIITGPSYIKDVAQVKACSQWIGSMIGKKFNNKQQQQLQQQLPTSLLNNKHDIHDDLLISIRTNLSKYNHPYNDPHNSSSIMTFEIEHGIPICRALLCELAEVCPIVGETCDTITPQYLNDLYCLGLVSSTLTESQLHRELASGVSYPVGFNTQDSELSFDKSMYVHKITAALDAMYATSQPHQFLSVTKIGTVAVVGTTGNEDTFIILQLNLQLNFDELKVIIKRVYSYGNLTRKTPRIMIDVGKISNDQYNEKLSILTQLLNDIETKHTIVGVMIDSGDNYIPDGFDINVHDEDDDDEEDEHDNGIEIFHDNEENHRKLLQLNKYFMKKRISKGIQAKLFKAPKVTSNESTNITNNNNNYRYENLINADKFISELNKLSKSRRS